MKQILRDRSTELQLPSAVDHHADVLWHLGTPFEARPTPEKTRDAGLSSLHPTPALSGFIRSRSADC